MAPTLLLPIDKPTPSFLGIPLEIRLEIYRYLLVVPGFIALDYGVAYSGAYMKLPTAILSVSKQISEEALDVLYRENMFAICLSSRDRGLYPYEFTAQNWQRVRCLTLHGQPYDDTLYDTYDVPYILTEALWPPIYADLAKLCIVVSEPLEPFDPF